MKIISKLDVELIMYEINSLTSDYLKLNTYIKYLKYSEGLFNLIEGYNLKKLKVEDLGKITIIDFLYSLCPRELNLFYKEFLILKKNILENE